VKTCSKCKRDLEEIHFVKSERYRDGLYPHCFDCRKLKRLAYLSKTKLCSRCKQRPHRNGHAWCAQCEHEANFTDRTPKFVRRPNTANPNFCSRCGERSPREYSPWCQPCFNDYQRQRNARLRGNPVQFRPEQLRKKTARHYINTLIKRGKIKYGPCYLCGEPGTQKHHLNYRDRTKDVIDTCNFCHVLIHRALRKLLTASTPV
jgi:hypothetical protein